MPALEMAIQLCMATVSSAAFTSHEKLALTVSVKGLSFVKNEYCEDFSATLFVISGPLIVVQSSLKM